jgi:hypothetical protein
MINCYWICCIFSSISGGDIMEALSGFFESINKFLGVSGPGDLIFHPAFIGFCLVIFLYATWVGMKYISLPVGGLMGGAVIYHYLWPKGDASSLGELVWAFGAFGALVMVVVYLGFIRD